MKHRHFSGAALGELSAAYPGVPEGRLCRVVELNRSTIRRTRRAPGELSGARRWSW